MVLCQCQPVPIQGTGNGLRVSFLLPPKLLLSVTEIVSKATLIFRRIFIKTKTCIAVHNGLTGTRLALPPSTIGKLD